LDISFALFNNKQFQCVNPFIEEQLNLLGAVPKHVCHFSLGCKPISRHAARRLIALHRKQNIESELKMANLLDFLHHNASKSNSVKKPFVS